MPFQCVPADQCLKKYKEVVVNAKPYIGNYLKQAL